MKLLSKKIYLRDHLGTSQSERYPDALSPEYFQVEEKQLKDYIDFISKYAHLINYYNEFNRLDGDWAVMFEYNITVLLIQISSIDSDLIEEKFFQYSNRLRNSIDVQKSQKELYDAFQFIYGHLLNIDSWSYKTESIPEFHNEIVNLINFNFSDVYSHLRIHEAYLFRNNLLTSISNTNTLKSNLNWNIKSTQLSKDKLEIENAYQLTKDKSDTEKIYFAIEQLLPLFQKTLVNMKLIIKSSKAYLDAHVNRSAEIQPHIGLFMAFIEIFNTARAEINKFTGRHLDYYFREILHFTERPYLPDKAHLVIEIENSADPVLIPKNTEFIGGKDANGLNLIYVSTKENVINHTSIAAIRSIINDELYKHEIDSSFNSIMEVSAVNRSFPAQNLFNQPENQELETNKLGFAISSSILLLEEGTRRVTFTFDIQRYSFNKFVDNFENKLVKENPEYRNINYSFHDFFRIAYSNEELFQAVNEKHVELKFLKNNYGNYTYKFELTILLEDADLPVTQCKDSRFHEAASKNLPVFKFLVNSNKAHLYNYFKDLIIERIHIEVDVLGVKNLKLQNNYGEISKNTQFEPFGPFPSVGSVFYIGHPSLFNCPLNELYINFDWSDVPLLDNGFAEYYEGYKFIDSNEAFKAKISILQNKKWHPNENPQLVNLFETIPQEKSNLRPVNNLRRIKNIDVARLSVGRVNQIENTDVYNNWTRNGYIKLEFAYPPTAFGHKEYNELLRKAAINNIKKKVKVPEPNEPYNPVIKEISIDYSTKLTIDLVNKNNQFDDFVYHINPFGENCVSKSKDAEIPLIPYYSKGSELYIGLQEIYPPQNVGILFQLDEFGGDRGSNNEQFEWSYLCNDQWVVIPDSRIIEDTTNKFVTSGIVTLDFSEKIESDVNRTLTDNYFWIRCKSKIGAGFIKQLKGIKTQAICVVFNNQGNDLSHLDEGIPAGSISTMSIQNPQINSITQYFRSFGGVSLEKPEEFRLRVSERLRHKDRAIVIWDYERMILQEFPFVLRVKCLNNLSPTLDTTPGSVLITVLPSVSKLRFDPNSEPKFSSNYLEQIQNFLKTRTSPFVKLAVINPVYERLKVKLKVKFHKGFDERFYLSVLNEDLKRFISPWLYDEHTKFNFQNSIRGISIVFYIETLHYVDYLTNFSIYHIINEQIVNADVAQKSDIILEPSSPVSILITDNEHIITLINEDTENQKTLNDMIVSKDFIVNSDARDTTITDGVGGSYIEESFVVDSEVITIVKKNDYLIRINPEKD